MKDQDISVEGLAKQLVEDIEEFKNDEILPQVVFMHLYRAYSLGTDANEKGWWETLDADDKYINSMYESWGLEAWDICAPMPEGKERYDAEQALKIELRRREEAEAERGINKIKSSDEDKSVDSGTWHYQTRDGSIIDVNDKDEEYLEGYLWYKDK